MQIYLRWSTYNTVFLGKFVFPLTWISLMLHLGEFLPFSTVHSLSLFASQRRFRFGYVAKTKFSVCFFISVDYSGNYNGTKGEKANKWTVRSAKMSICLAELLALDSWIKVKGTKRSKSSGLKTPLLIFIWYNRCALETRMPSSFPRFVAASLSL